MSFETTYIKHKKISEIEKEQKLKDILDEVRETIKSNYEELKKLKEYINNMEEPTKLEDIIGYNKETFIDDIVKKLYEGMNPIIEPDVKKLKMLLFEGLLKPSVFKTTELITMIEKDNADKCHDHFNIKTKFSGVNSLFYTRFYKARFPSFTKDELNRITTKQEYANLYMEIDPTSSNPTPKNLTLK